MGKMDMMTTGEPPGGGPRGSEQWLTAIQEALVGIKPAGAQDIRAA